MPDATQPEGHAPLPGELHDRSVRPAGLLPRNTQTYVVLAITVIMVGAIAFSGGTSSKQSPNAQPKAAAVIDPNLARIQDYRNRIDEEARKLAQEQAQLEQTKQVLGIAPPVQAHLASPSAAPTRPSSPPLDNVSAPRPPVKSALESELEVEKQKREYQSLFASNIALTYRKNVATMALAVPQILDQTVSSAAMPSQITVPDTPHSASASALQPLRGASTDTMSPSQGPSDRNLSEAHSSESFGREAQTRPLQREHIDPTLQTAEGKTYRLFEGSIIETVLTNRLEGSFDGPVNCLVTTDVYSHDYQHLLIPKGSRILGEVKRNDMFGQQRLAVFFHRLLMPDGYSVSLDQFKGLSQIGETGLRDQVNHHYAEIFGVSLAIGAIAGLSNVNTSYGLNASSTDAYRQGVTASLSQSSLRMLDKYLNVLPTFKIREGQRIKVFLSGDLALPAYEQHRIPSDL